jgi:hypothetical protein
LGFEKFGKFGYVSQTKIASMVSFLEKDQLPATRCKKCKTLHFPPRADCQNCRNASVDWVTLDGSCTLVTFTEVHFAPPQFQAEAPYLLGLAELKEGPRVFAPIDSKIDRSTVKPGVRMVLRVEKRGGDGLYYQLQK